MNTRIDPLDEDESLAYEIIKALAWEDLVAPVMGIPKLVVFLRKRKAEVRAEAVRDVIACIENHSCVSTCCDYQKPGSDVEVLDCIKKHFAEGADEYVFSPRQYYDDGWRKGVEAEAARLGASSLRQKVIDFHKKFAQPISGAPHVPDDATVRFRLKLIAEEFFELLYASGFEERKGDGSEPSDVNYARALVGRSIEEDDINVDLLGFVDALCDLAYVIEGTHIVFGVDSGPVLEEVHACNMLKEAVYVAAKDDYHKNVAVKPTKPAGWKPPDVARVLREQGWRSRCRT